MKEKRANRGRLRQQMAGQALVLFALALTVVFALAGLALDGGVAQSVRRGEQAISDGAALAGAIELTSNPTPAQQKSAMTKAVAYATAGLAGGGSVSPDPSCGAPVPPTLTCQPDAKHTLIVTTPFDGNGTDIMVQLGDLEPTGLTNLVGINQVTIASRSVARHASGGGPFGYAVYVSGNLTSNGNPGAVQTFVQGDVYVGGCVVYTNADSLTTNASPGGPPGNVEIYGTNGAQQSWTSGNGSACDAHIYAAGFGATGNANNTGVSCPMPPVAGVGGCSNTPPYAPNHVPLVGIPTYEGLVDSTNCQLAGTPKLAAWQIGGNGRVQPGCYDPCKISSVTDGMVFDAGDYAFFGNGTQNGCNFNFGGMSSSGTASGSGVTFWLYNGTGMCSTSGCQSSGKGTLNFSAPTSGPNTGLLIYNPCQNTGCTGNGSIFLKGPNGAGGAAVTAKYSFTGLIYAPYSSCTILANAGEVITGQVVCKTAQLQGGTPSAGFGVYYGGASLPQNVFDVQLIE
jgi:Flp pilus assembly protein TadG